MANPILLYDGVCGLCNRLIQFILRRDRDEVFRFASLQSALATVILSRHAVNAADLDTVYIVLNCNEPDESLLARSDAVIFVLQHLGLVWRACAFVFQLLPQSVRDWKYRIVARRRYRIFGRYDTCPLPSTETRARFLDLE